MVDETEWPLGRIVRESLSLNRVRLWSSTVTRGDGDADRPGKGSIDRRLEGHIGPEGGTFDVMLELDLSDDDDGHVAQMAITLRSDYSFQVEGVEGVGDNFKLSRSDEQWLGKTAIVQAAPYQREFVSSMTGRMGIPQFMLPLEQEEALHLGVPPSEVQ